jgi:hypothetical protein
MYASMSSSRATSMRPSEELISALSRSAVLWTSRPGTTLISALTDETTASRSLAARGPSKLSTATFLS